MYASYVSTRGNPDYNQWSPISEAMWFEAESLDELRAKIRGYTRHYQVGGGNWNSPIVYLLTRVTGLPVRKKKLGRLSYNMRLFTGKVSDASTWKTIDEPSNWDVIPFEDPYMV